MPNKSRSKKANNKRYRLKTNKTNKKGGSLASVPVVDAANGNAPGMKGYKDHMHLPPMEELRGGSRASDRLSSFMTNKSTEPRSELLASSEFTNASMDGFRTDTYQLTGGAKGDMKRNLVALINVARKHPDMSADKLVENFHASRPMAGRITENDLKNGKPKMAQKGGNGFLSLAGCGPVNVPDAGRKYAGEFTKSGMCPGPEWYANPPNLGSAGSGMSDLGVGAPAL